jgi:hypothetical protein
MNHEKVCPMKARAYELVFIVIIYYTPLNVIELKLESKGNVKSSYCSSSIYVRYRSSIKDDGRGPNFDLKPPYTRE